MRSKRLAVCISLLMISGCGVLGEKPSPPNTFAVEGQAGCLNDSGKFVKYWQGQISGDDWKSGWNCAITAVQRMQQLSEAGRNYEPGQIQLIMTNLVTDSPIPLEIIRAGIQLKASLFGGSTAVVEPGILNQVIAVLGVIRDQSAALIPYLAQRRVTPNPANMAALAEAIRNAGAQIAASFQTIGNADFPKLALQQLVHDIGTMNGGTFDDSRFVTLWLGKQILFGGAPDKIEAWLWPTILAAATSGGGDVLALLSFDSTLAHAPNEVGEFVYAISEDFAALLRGGMRLNGGAIPLAWIKQLVASLPAGTLGKVSTASFGQALDSASARLFKSYSAGMLDSGMLDSVMSTFNQWRQGQTALETIFLSSALNPAEVQPTEFVEAANQYLASLPVVQQPVVKRLAGLAVQYRALFNQGAQEISFSPKLPLTLTDLTDIHWMNLVANLLEAGYSTSAAAGGTATLSRADFTALFSDFGGIGSDLQLIDLTVPNYADRRLREADLYMYSSDGNGTVSQDELTYYIAFLQSVLHQGTRIRADLESACGNPAVVDGMGWHPMDADCFRRGFFANVVNYFDHAPGLQAFYSAINAKDLPVFQHDLEEGSRLGGYSENPIGGYDTLSIASEIHYVESTFARYDVNGDGTIDAQESLPFGGVLANVLAQASGVAPSQTNELLAIYTFILNFEKIPPNDFWGELEVAAWLLIRPTWQFNTTRANFYRMSALFPQSQATFAP